MHRAGDPALARAYFGFDAAGTKAFFTFVSTYNDGANPQHYQQQIVASLEIP